MPNRRRKDVTRYRDDGARDPAAKAAHAEDTTSWRRTIAEIDFNADDQAHLIKAIRNGATLRQAAANLGLTYQAVYGRAAWDVQFAEALERVLEETCPAGDRCGRPAGVKHGGHCHRCRAAHHPSRTDRRRQR